jgi:hypothetical protein
VGGEYYISIYWEEMNIGMGVVAWGGHTFKKK